ncbi:hypothetical protein BD770DRAFT_432316 [Pilaira anomala]|nr:hypothetical protein BD770DRAFT_432316 [Pilaira anomala]
MLRVNPNLDVNVRVSVSLRFIKDKEINLETTPDEIAEEEVAPADGSAAGEVLVDNGLQEEGVADSNGESSIDKYSSYRDKIFYYGDIISKERWETQFLGGGGLSLMSVKKMRSIHTRCLLIMVKRWAIHSLTILCRINCESIAKTWVILFQEINMGF